jgi:hypothetical protein
MKKEKHYINHHHYHYYHHLIRNSYIQIKHKIMKNKKMN